jgi:hypothetical protein
LAQSPHWEQQHDREQQKDQEWRRFLLSDNDYDRKDIIISIDDVSAMFSSPSSSAPIGDDDHIINNKNIHNHQGKAIMMKQKRNKVVSFRLSEAEYSRYLSMAKLCYENGLTKGPDIVSYIRLSMECLSRYITSQAEAERSAQKKGEEQQQQLEIKKEGSMEQHDLNNYHAITASSSSRAAAARTNTAMGEQDTRESIARTPTPSPPTPSLLSLHEYFKPVFDEIDNLNKRLDSLIEEENDKAREKKKK